MSSAASFTPMGGSYAAGFTDLDQEVTVDRLPVQGTWPDWLSGTLLRTGPCKFDLGRQTINHWFDGLAMLHKFSFADGRVSYANRFLHSDAYHGAAKTGGLTLGGFATDPCASIFQRVMAIFVASARTTATSASMRSHIGRSH